MGKAANSTSLTSDICQAPLREHPSKQVFIEVPRRHVRPELVVQMTRAVTLKLHGATLGLVLFAVLHAAFNGVALSGCKIVLLENATDYWLPFQIQLGSTEP